MAHSVLMPQAGQSMTEGKIVEWFVEEGATVNRGDPLLVIETDKANMDVEAPASGVVRKVFHAADEVVPVLELLAVIGGADEEIDFDALRQSAAQQAGAQSATSAAAESSAPAASASPPPPPAAAKQSVSSSPPAAHGAPSSGPATVAPAATDRSAPPGAPRSSNGDGHIRTSPLARRLARIRGIDIRTLRGSGPSGRIIRRDVEAAGAAGGVAQAIAGPPSPVAAKPYPPPSPRPPDRVVIDGMRRAIGTALQQSKTRAPHFYLTVEIDVTAALELRQGLEAQGIQISVNDLVVRAVAIALVDEPRVNCRVSDEAIEYPREVNIGVAVGLDEGLVVPVVLGADQRDLAGIAEETRRIIDAARQGKLIGMGRGTFTISNLGMFGVDAFTAVINPPEGAILAVGAATPRLVPLGGGFFPRTILRATISADHRAIDGLLAAKFMARVKRLLEEPERLR